MNPIFIKKYKISLCRHWLIFKNCPIGVRCIFAHGLAQLRNPNDPITVNQNIFYDPKMNNSFMTTSYINFPQISQTTSSQKLESLNQKKIKFSNSIKLIRYRLIQNTLTTTQDYSDKPHFDITKDPIIRKRIFTAQIKLIIRQILTLQLNPNIKYKVIICQKLLEVGNLDSCQKILNQIIEKKTTSYQEKRAYEMIIQQASQLQIPLIAEQKKYFQKSKKGQLNTN